MLRDPGPQLFGRTNPNDDPKKVGSRMPLPRSAFPPKGVQLETYGINADEAALKRSQEPRTRGNPVVIPCVAAARALAGYFQEKGFEVVHHRPGGLPSPHRRRSMYIPAKRQRA